MVVIERRLAGLFAYKMVFFAPQRQITSIAENLRPTEIARFFYTSDRFSGPRVPIRSERSFTICNDLLLPVSKIWKGFAHCNHTDIRKADGLGSRVRIERNEKAPRSDFLSVFNEFARLKDGVRPISARLLRRYEPFSDRIVLYLDEQPSVVMLMLRDRGSGRVRGLYQGSRRLQDSAHARVIGNLNRFLHWHNMRAYREEGFRQYDWGGISQDEMDGRTTFKMSFGGRVVEEYSHIYAGWARLGLVFQTLFEFGTSRGRMARKARLS